MFTCNRTSELFFSRISGIGESGSENLGSQDQEGASPRGSIEYARRWLIRGIAEL